MEFGAGLVPLEGGWSGETFLAEMAGERSVVRIFASERHHPRAAEIGEAVHRLVRGLVPAPPVLEVRRADPAAGTPGLLVTGFVEGVRGDQVLPTLEDAARAGLGERLGRLAGTLAGMPGLVPGTFADATLAVDPFVPELPDWVADHAERLAWEEPDLASLVEVAEAAQQELDATARWSLVHSDLNPKNVLVDPDTLEVTALVDWEYAHIGSPFTDLGNLLRLDRDPAYADGVLRGYTEVRGGDPGAARHTARCADLVALIELAARRDANPVAARAHDRLLAVARSRDVDATE